MELQGLGVFGAETPNRAARAVGHDTAVAHGAGPPPRRAFPRLPGDGARAAVSRPSGRASLTQGEKSPTPQATLSAAAATPSPLRGSGGALSAEASRGTEVSPPPSLPPRGGGAGGGG